MSLIAMQRAMRDDILADDNSETAPGLTVYRNAYRNRLLGALQDNFELTRRWVGDDAFDAAARHHIILHPPVSWTLDNYGLGFDQTLTELFAEDPEVGELAWLEWQMQRAFGALDTQVLDVAMLTSDELGVADWETVCFALVPSFAMRAVAKDCVSLWQALADDDMPSEALPLPLDSELIVWRKGFSPHFRIVDAAERKALAAVAAGQQFGELCAAFVGKLGPEQAMAQAGTLLGRWVQDGLIAGVQADNETVST